MTAILLTGPAWADDAAKAPDDTPAVHARDEGNPDLEEPMTESRLQLPDVPLQSPDVAPKEPEHVEHHGMEEYGPVTLQVMLAPHGKLAKDETADVVLTLKDKDGNPLSEDQLEERHTRKIHLLIVDDSLTDYQHVHPAYVGKAGEFVFTFTPKTAHGYHVFTDVKPVAGAPEMVLTNLPGTDMCEKSCVDEKEVFKAAFGGNKAKLSFDGPVVAGKPAMGTVSIVDAGGQPLKVLEPVMGAYAHVAGFYADGHTAVHSHPLGTPPKDDDSRGASPLTFMLHADKPGFLKIFVQVRVGGSEAFLPFGVRVGG